MQEPEKLCIFCRYSYWGSKVEYYSEHTPGWAAELSCTKHKAKGNYLDAISLKDFRIKLRYAEICPDYEAVK